MRGLVFNLLQSVALETGCSEEAWELVTEFASADLPADLPLPAAFEASDIPTRAFDIPAEAMLRCLGRNQEPGSVAELELMEALSLDDSEPSYPATAPSYPLPVSLRSGIGFNFVTALRNHQGVEEAPSPSLQAMYPWLGKNPAKD